MKPHQTLLFYKYVRLESAQLYAEEHLQFCKKIGIKGRVLIADEGINGTTGGNAEQCQMYMDYLRGNPYFADIEFKIDEEDEPSFNKIHVRYRKEIVHFGIPIDPELSGQRLPADEVLAMKDQPDVVMVDMRNDYEYGVGKFKNALTLDLENYRDLPDKIAQLEPYKDKKIIAYCTGGIRCEKATAFLIQQAGFDRQNVFHIDGGIIKYAKLTGGKDFEGKCYVFDKRVVIDVNTVNPTLISTCRICRQASARMVNCANPECNEHFVLCETCGTTMQGCCSDTCLQHPRRRPYDGTGYYARNGKQL